MRVVMMGLVAATEQWWRSSGETEGGVGAAAGLYVVHEEWCCSELHWLHAAVERKQPHDYLFD